MDISEKNHDGYGKTPRFPIEPLMRMDQENSIQTRNIISRTSFVFIAILMFISSSADREGCIPAITPIGSPFLDDLGNRELSTLIGPD
jgi:hypothetical protein